MIFLAEIIPKEYDMGVPKRYENWMNRIYIVAYAVLLSPYRKNSEGMNGFQEASFEEYLP